MYLDRRPRQGSTCNFASYVVKTSKHLTGFGKVITEGQHVRKKQIHVACIAFQGLSLHGSPRQG